MQDTKQSTHSNMGTSRTWKTSEQLFGYMMVTSWNWCESVYLSYIGSSDEAPGLSPFDQWETDDLNWLFNQTLNLSIFRHSLIKLITIIASLSFLSGMDIYTSLAIPSTYFHSSRVWQMDQLSAPLNSPSSHHSRTEARSLILTRPSYNFSIRKPNPLPLNQTRTIQ